MLTWFQLIIGGDFINIRYDLDKYLSSAQHVYEVPSMFMKAHNFFKNNFFSILLQMIAEDLNVALCGDSLIVSLLEL